VRQKFVNYPGAEGLEIDLVAEATVKDLLALLKIAESLGVVVVRNGRLLKKDEKILPGDRLYCIQAMPGG
jgi:sulfur carrier protein ThiS